MFVGIGFPLNDPTNLFMSFILISFALLIYLSSKTLIISQSQFKLIFLILTILGLYCLSAFENNQSLNSFVLGAYQRNMGFATLLSIFLIFIYSLGNSRLAKNFMYFGLNSLLVLSIIYGYIQYLGFDPINWTRLNSPGRGIVLTLGNVNFAGALFGILSIVCLHKLLYEKSLKLKLINCFLFVSTLFLGFETRSLQATAISIISLVVFTVLYNLSKNNYINLLFTSIGIIISLLFIVVYIFTSDRFIRLREKILVEGSIIPRFDYMSTGIKIWNDHKLFGVGIDQYGRHAATYRNTEQITRDGFMTIPDKAHNIFIDHLANGGLIVALCWIILVLIISSKVIKTVLLSEKKDRLLTVTLSTIWFGWLMQSLISPDHILLTLIGFSSAGLVIGSSNMADQKRKIDLRNKFNSLQNISLSLILVFILSFYFFTISADYKGKQILSGKNRNPDSIIEVINSWPSPKVTELIGVELSKDANNCIILPKIAERLIDIETRSAQGWFMYAVCEIYTANYVKAISKIDKSLLYDPSNPFYLIEKARIEIEIKQYQDAKKTLNIVKSIVPNNPQVIALEELFMQRLD